MRTRPSARVLLLDQSGCVLLFRFSGGPAGSGYWATPGGAVEDGETFEQAALRELEEETGVSLQQAGREIGRRSFPLRLTDGEIVRAEERYFASRTKRQSVSEDGWSANERQVMTDHHWWSAEELRQTTETVFPDGLLELLEEADRIRSDGPQAPGTRD